jgi:uncharacterized protein
LSGTSSAPAAGGPSAEDIRAVTVALGRIPGGDFTVVVRRADGRPVVIANDPLLRDGKPMPTRYWLVDPAIRGVVAALESQGGVRRAEREVDATELDAAHARYAAERDVLVPPEWTGHRPAGGVGGTRRGVKCLHAHLAWWLAGGDDPVGRWVSTQVDLPLSDVSGVMRQP